MDELIILLIKGIARMLGGGDAPRRPAQQPQGQPQTPNVPAAWQEQIRRAAAMAQKTAQAKGRGRRPAPPPPPAKAPQPVAVVKEAAAPAKAPPTARKIPPVIATNLHNWLSPAVLQRQFILTEILQPPLALREKK
jgi:hypothetical protein